MKWPGICCGKRVIVLDTWHCARHEKFDDKSVAFLAWQSKQHRSKQCPRIAGITVRAACAGMSGEDESGKIPRNTKITERKGSTFESGWFPRDGSETEWGL